MLLDHSASCAAVDLCSRNALHFCCLLNDKRTIRAEIVKCILTHAPEGQEMMADSQGRLPLHYSVQNGLLECFQELCRANPQALHIEDKTGVTPYQLAQSLVGK